MRLMYAVPLILVVGCAPVAPPTSVELCEQTVQDYGPLRDDGPAEHYADLFAEDGEFHLGPNVTKGRDALIDRHVKSNAASIWRHTMTDIRIVENDKGLSGTTRFHIFTGPKGDKPGAPAREILGDYVDEFEIAYGACKIKSRKIKIVFDTSS